MSRSVAAEDKHIVAVPFVLRSRGRYQTVNRPKKEVTEYCGGLRSYRQSVETAEFLPEFEEGEDAPRSLRIAAVRQQRFLQKIDLDRRIIFADVRPAHERKFALIEDFDPACQEPVFP